MPPSPPDVTWFRLAVRAIGIMVLAWNIPTVLQHISYVSLAFKQNRLGGNSEALEWYVLPSISPLAGIGVGLYLLLGAAPLIRFCTRGALGMCPACNYDIRNVPGATCPECGVALPGRTGPNRDSQA